MMRSILRVVTLSGFYFSSVLAVPVASPQNEFVTLNACAAVGAVFANENAVDLKPSEILPCLQQVPIVKTDAASLINFVLNLVQFQTTLAYLKNPPKGYNFPAVDLVGGLQNILKKVNAGSYPGQYAFESELSTLIQSAEEGHLKFRPVLATSFYVKKPPLVSMSVNGNDLPSLFFRNDVNISGFTPSALTKIDDQDATAYITARLSGSGLQDKDAAFNSQFFNPATWVKGGNGGFGQYTYLKADTNDTTVYTFANGTTVSLNNTVVSKLQLNGITSADDIYQAFILAFRSSSVKRSVIVKKQDLQLTTLTLTATPTLTASLTSINTDAAYTSSVMSSMGFPTPVAMADDLSVGGYFVPDQPDTAVLVINAFTSAETSNVGALFSKTVTKFLDACRSANKKKLLVDVRGNGGGVTSTAYDTFKQIFPTAEMFTRLGYRYHPTMDAIGTVLSHIDEIELGNLNAPRGSDLDYINQASVSPFRAENYLQYPNGQPFTSWGSFEGPINKNGDTFTKDFSLDFTSVARSLYIGADLVVSGYGNNTNIAPQVFDPANVTMITDGACSSSCGIFTNLMINQGNASTITFGGQPSKNPVVAIGGTQGALVQTYGNLQLYAQIASSLVIHGLILSTPDHLQLLEDLQVTPAITINGGISSAAVNFYDNMHADSDVPLQFRQINSDCRLFYTADDINNISKTWSKVSSGNFTCVDGGSKPGTTKPGTTGPRKKNSGSILSPRNLYMACLIPIVSVLLMC